jgi:hypothetical protein
MIVDTINYKAVWTWINAVWAKSFIAIILFLLGLWIGTVQTEGRIAGDCKFAGAFRVDIQAFACQRRL